MRRIPVFANTTYLDSGARKGGLEDLLYRETRMLHSAHLPGMKNLFPR
jgi:hypothetical protein